MEFLFLNEAAVNDIDSFKAFVEENYGEISPSNCDSIGEVLIEAEETFHEAEMQAMRDEFELYQESCLLNEEDSPAKKESLWTKAKEQIKKWWAALVKTFWTVVDFIVRVVDKTWGAILKLYKKVQMKFKKGEKLIISTAADNFAHASLWGFTDIKKNKDAIVSASNEEAAKNISEAKLKELKDNTAKFSAESKKTKEVSYDEWKKTFDLVINKIDSWRKFSRNARSEISSDVKANDAKIKALKDESSKKDIVETGKKLKVAITYLGKSCSTITSACRKTAWSLAKATVVGKKKEDEK